MKMGKSKQNLLIRRRLRVRNRLKKFANDRIRMSVHRSSKNFYVQLIDDQKGVTLASVSTLEKKLNLGRSNNVEVAKKIGMEIGKRAKIAGVTTVYFDRGGLLFHGRVKALADAARESGLQF